MISRGVLALVVGPSGAGKDTLLSAAREALAGDPRFHFCKRIITRKADIQSEDHATYSTDQFVEAERTGQFFLSWRSHGLCYALPANIQDALQSDKIVIANVSRSVIPVAETLASNVSIFTITAPADVLLSRLVMRGRESIDDVRKRVQRFETVAPARSSVVEIENSGVLADASSRFIDQLLKLIPNSKPMETEL